MNTTSFARVSQLYTTAMFVPPNGKSQGSVFSDVSIAVRKAIPVGNGVNFRVSRVSIPGDLQQVVDYFGGEGRDYIGGIFILLLLVDDGGDQRPQDKLAAIAGVIATSLDLQLELCIPETSKV